MGMRSSLNVAKSNPTMSDNQIITIVVEKFLQEVIFTPKWNHILTVNEKLCISVFPREASFSHKAISFIESVSLFSDNGVETGRIVTYFEQKTRARIYVLLNKKNILGVATWLISFVAFADLLVKTRECVDTTYPHTISTGYIPVWEK